MKLKNPIVEKIMQERVQVNEGVFDILADPVGYFLTNILGSNINKALNTLGQEVPFEKDLNIQHPEIISTRRLRMPTPTMAYSRPEGLNFARASTISSDSSLQS